MMTMPGFQIGIPRYQQLSVQQLIYQFVSMEIASVTGLVTSVIPMDDIIWTAIVHVGAGLAMFPVILYSCM